MNDRLRHTVLCLALGACAYPTDFGATPGAYDTGAWANTYSYAYRTTDWEQRSEVWDELTGLAPSRDGRAWVGMSGSACRLGLNGGLQDDIDPLLDTTERVTDADEVIVVEDAPTEVVVVVDDDAGAVATVDTQGEVVHQHEVPGLVHALSDGRGDAVVLADDPVHGCAVAFHEGRVRTLVPVPLKPCAVPDGFSADRKGGVAFVGTGTAAFRVTREGSEPLAMAGDRLAWDGHAGVLYVGTAGEVGLAALEPGGRIRWTTDLAGPVRLVRAMGRRGAAAVAVRAPEGDAVWIVHGRTGEAHEAIAGSPHLSSLAVSADGDTLWLSGAATTASFRAR